MLMFETRSNPQVAPQMAATSVILPPSERVFRIGLVIKDRILPERAAVALSDITSPLSECQITSVAILQDHESSDLSDEEILEQYHIHPARRNSPSTLLFGDGAFGRILKSDVDAVYILVPAEVQSEYALAALQARKHVLLDDPASTPLDEFRQQLVCAQQVKRLVQFPTMFSHRHRVQSFLGVVLPEKFGDIQSVDATFFLNYNDLDKVGVSFPLTPGQGCIRRLGRHCALVTALIMIRAGCRPISAKVTRVIRSGKVAGAGEPLQADCLVRFTGDRVLKISVGYSGNATRQVLEVKSHHRYATMTDFVLPHPDGLTSYRLYDKELDPVTGKLEIKRGEALDVPQGLSEGITMWRHFRCLCNSVQEQGWTECPQTLDVIQVTGVALQTKRILTALEQSLAEDGKEVQIAMEDFNVL